LEEKAFLNDGAVYVSNSRVVLQGTTYATANITSVSKRITPANTGCATLMIAVGALCLLGTLVALIAGTGSDMWGLVLISAIIIGVGVLIFRSQKPIYHVVLASSSGERQGLTTRDELLVNRVVGAITEAIIYRG
jgi:uncharacterized protein DUF6232